MATKLQNLTSNQYWGGINRRQDNRLRKLLKAGYKYCPTRNAVYNPRKVRYTETAKRHEFMEIAILGIADNRYFFERLKMIS